MSEELEQDNDIHIEVIVKSLADDSEIRFRIKKTTKMKKLMKSYCALTGQSMDNLRFLYYTERVLPDQTANDLGLKNHDTIDSLVQQVGGTK